MLEQGERFFKTVGPWGVLIGRFFGPLRAVVPLCAGAMGMKFLPFLVMSALSAPLFIAIYVLPGALVAYGMTSDDGMSLSTILPMALPLLIGLAGAYFIMQRYKQAYNLKDEAELDR
jgi:membrane protein DedA with SNARE-associated domain